MAIPSPMRYVDRSGRSLVWVLLHEGENWHVKREVHFTDECRIEMCPRPQKGQPQDIESRPCHSEGTVFFRLKDDLHEWLEAQVSNYQLEYRWHDSRLGWYVGFAPEERDRAVLFKLTFAP